MRRLLILLFLIISVLNVSVYATEVRIKETYDENSGFYRYSVADESYVESNVRLGGVIDNAVMLEATDDVELTLYKDGKQEEMNMGNYIYSNGEYTLVISKDDLSGKVNFVIDKSVYQSMDLSDEFYNTVAFKQSYDNKRAMYKLDMGNYFTFYTSVPNNAITSKGVKIYTPKNDDVTIAMEKDGEEINFSSGQTFSDSGYYSIHFMYSSPDTPYDSDVENITDSDLMSVTTSDMDNVQLDTPSESNPLNTIADVATYSFIVYDKPQNKLNYINPPQDYSIESVTLNGRKTNVGSVKCYRATKDGIYKIAFKSDTLPAYSCTFERDTQSPTLTFFNLEKGGKAKDSLSFEKDDKNSVVTVTNNEVPYDASDGTIDEDGLYKIVVSDTAGNFTTYLVNVEKTVKISIFFVIAVFVAVIAAVAVYVRYVKNNICIR